MTSNPDLTVENTTAFERILKQVSAQLWPSATVKDARYPKGVIFYGASEAKKVQYCEHVAKQMNLLPIEMDWSSLSGVDVTQTESYLDFLTHLNAANTPTLLYWHNFDQAFSSWDFNVGGNVQIGLAGKLLTWLQERSAPVYVIAIVNRLELLPAEINRRFDIVLPLGD